MPSGLIGVILLLPLIYAANTAWCLFLNIRAARASSIPYVVVPWYTYNIALTLLAKPLHQVLDKLYPNPAPTSWRRLVGAGWLWKMRHQPFVDLGTDNFLVVSPGGIIMYVADADVISQVTPRDREFPKATLLYRNVNIYGENILSSEGATWRKYRKLTASSFSEKNNRLVWKETLEQTKQMLDSWTGPADSPGRTVQTVGRDAMRLSLTVISRAGLGQEMDWAATGENESRKLQHLPDGHKLSATSSLEHVLSHVFYIMAIPHWLLKNLPSPVMKKSYQAYDEWGRYMRDMVTAKRAQLKAATNDDRETIDIIGQFLKAQEESISSTATLLSESEIIGNLFVFTMAGHETAANSIHFTLLLLALHPDIQKQVQDDLHYLFADHAPSDWQYERDFPRLYNSILGATLHEQLRLITPVSSIPKRVGSSPQPLVIDGKQVSVPANTMVRLCVHAVHRNPRFWPHGPPKEPGTSAFPPGNADNDLEEFKPSRWLQQGWDPTTPAVTSEAADKVKDAKPADEIPSPFFVPQKGAYLPFSDGARACSGKRFAQTEILAALALILTQYTVELAVDEWANDEEVENMTLEEKRKVWERAKRKATHIWQQKMKCVITLQIRGAHVPVRFVERGRERFAGFGGG